MLSPHTKNTHTNNYTHHGQSSPSSLPCFHGTFVATTRSAPARAWSVVINGNGGGAVVSCDHVYGPPFGPSGAGDLSITIAMGRRNARSRRCPRHHYRRRCRCPLSPSSSSTPPMPPQLSSSADAVTIVIFAGTAAVIVVIVIADYTSLLLPILPLSLLVDCCMCPLTSVLIFATRQCRRS